MKTYVISVAIPLNWFGSSSIKQVEIRYPETKTLTYTDAMREVRSTKKWRKFNVISIMEK